MNIKYPLAKETINEEDVDALCQWLKSYPRLTKGQLTWDVEEAWSKYIGTKYAVFNNSGSSANLLMVYAAIMAGRIKNKKIVVPSVGWVTTIAPAIQFGLNPIMVGADPKTFGIDLDQLEAVCEKERPDAVIYVQVLGVPHYRERLLALKGKYGFTLLEDACAALGASYSDGQMVGTIGDMSSFSFYFGHQLSTIEGGMVNTSDKELYETLLMLRSHGWGKDLPKDSYNKLIEDNDVDDFHKPFTFFVAGFNLRSTDLQAFLGLRQIDKAAWVSDQRNKNHLLYAELLEGYVEFQDWHGHNPVSISFGALANSTEHRKEIVTRLVENGIETRIFSAGNLGRHPFWTKRYGEFKDKMSDRIHSCGFFVPNYPELTEEEIKYICGIIRGDQ
jgi:CDP-6-deoxy-D-xylo-4-hexulose-3-dehydrase|tara:strand:- start:24221 stop:25387 length:1167 start_codon:yes stop_codon:yes gene_type:complete